MDKKLARRQWAGLADACSSSTISWLSMNRQWCSVSVRGYSTNPFFFSAAAHLLDHSRNPPPHSYAVASPSSVACRSASRGACSDDFVLVYSTGSAGKLLYLLYLLVIMSRVAWFFGVASAFRQHCGLFSAPCRMHHAGHTRKGSRGLISSLRLAESLRIWLVMNSGLFCRGPIWQAWLAQSFLKEGARAG